MSANELLTWLTRLFFVLLGILTLIGFVRHRSKTRLDIALVANSLAVPTLIGAFTALTGTQIRWLSVVSSLALAAQPYLLLRVIQHFRPVPRVVWAGALGGMAATWALLIMITLAPAPLPTWAALSLFASLYPMLSRNVVASLSAGATVAVVAYFALVNGYAMVGFIRGAMSSTGVTRQRLRFAAIGSGLLGLALLLAGARVVVPSVGTLITPLIQVASMLCAVSYYLGFAPPRWLHSAWQLAELRQFLLQTTGMPAAERVPQRLQHLCQAATQVVGGLSATVALWDAAEKRLLVKASNSAQLSSASFSVDNGLIGRAWHTRKPVMVSQPDEAGSEGAQIMAMMDAEALYVVPLATKERAWGLLLVLRRYGALFPGDDLNLLALFAEPSAIALENAELLAQQRTLMESAPDAVVVVNREGRITLVNAQTENLFGYNRDQLLDQPVELLMPQRLHNAHVGHRADYFAHPRTRPSGMGQNLIGRRKDGTEFPADITLSPLATATDVSVISIIRDITERKQAEEQLRFQANILANITDAILVTDMDLKIQSWNQGAEVIYGWSADEVVGKSVVDLLQTEYPLTSREEVLAYLHKKGEWKGEVNQKRKDGTRVFILASASLMKDSQGKPVSIVRVNRDISERKHAEETLKHLNDTLIQYSMQLEAANKELESFSYSVSHDLRAPLRAIDGFSRILLEDYAPKLEAAPQRYLNLVRDNAQQMGRLIDDLLTFSRLSRQPLNKQSVVIGKLVQQTLDSLKDAQANRQVEITLGELPECEADPALIRQVFFNLAANSLKFTSKRDVARIEIGCQRQNGEHVYYVRDNGVGFDMQYADKLFGVFQRLHRAEDYEGTGVGLATVQRIIRRHGGRIWADAAVDRGATFYFTLEGEHTDE